MCRVPLCKHFASVNFCGKQRLCVGLPDDLCFIEAWKQAQSGPIVSDYLEESAVPMRTAEALARNYGPTVITQCHDPAAHAVMMSKASLRALGLELRESVVTVDSV